MATKETQKRILDKSVELFNMHGASRISANRIADECGLSRGNLHYHFKNKDAIVHAVYDRISGEIKNDWGDDLEQPSVEHMLRMFERQLDLIWRYRFFYRELMALLAENERLQRRFSADRQARTEVLIRYFEMLILRNVLTGPTNRDALEKLVKLSWILSDHWINYVSVETPNAYPECVNKGFELLIELFYPYLSSDTRSTLEEWRIL